jgi:hypothetical protein
MKSQSSVEKKEERKSSSILTLIAAARSAGSLSQIVTGTSLAFEGALIMI